MEALLLVKFLETNDASHDANYLFTQMEQTMLQYGVDKFFVAIGDNASNEQAALKLVIEKYPHIVTMGCISHLMNLLCGDVMKCASAKQIISTCKSIIKKIKRSHKLTALVKQLQSQNKINCALKLQQTTHSEQKINKQFCRISSHVKSKPSNQYTWQQRFCSRNVADLISIRKKVWKRRNSSIKQRKICRWIPKSCCRKLLITKIKPEFSKKISYGWQLKKCVPFSGGRRFTEKPSSPKWLCGFCRLPFHRRPPSDRTVHLGGFITLNEISQLEESK